MEGALLIFLSDGPNVLYHVEWNVEGLSDNAINDGYMGKNTLSSVT